MLHQDPTVSPLAVGRFVEGRNGEIPWIRATAPLVDVPNWATYEIAVLEALAESAQLYEDRYCLPDGSLEYPDLLQGRDGADDFYEAFYNFPLLYLLGGADDLLDRARFHWEAITAQLTKMDFLLGEYERGYDWFHQSESLLLLYNLCLADPSDERSAERVCRFAELFVDPKWNNFDPDKLLIRGPHNGAGGARENLNDASEYRWSADMAQYGLPLDGVEGVTSFDDLRSPAAASAMGRAMNERMGKGDVVVNLLSTSLVSLAYLISGDERYRQWVLAYVERWERRAMANGGLVPDNVGRSGKVGEYLDGRWFGGHYGWSWPHGLESVASATAVAGSNALLLTGDSSHLEMSRSVLDTVLAHSISAPLAGREMSRAVRWAEQFGPELAAAPMLLVPHRFSHLGWFDYQPMYLILPLSLWHASGQGADLARIEQIRSRAGYDWASYRDFRNKHDAGHEDAWFAYLSGDFPEYPVRALKGALAIIDCRLARMQADQSSERPFDIHRWQELNPVTTEGLIQLMTGSPSPIYNGGLTSLRLRYFDALRGRPGVPQGVAVLVKSVESERLAVEIVNTNVRNESRLVVQAGTFAEDAFTRLAYDELAGDGTWPGSRKTANVPTPGIRWRVTELEHDRFGVEVPPRTRIALELRIKRRANPPALWR